MQLETQEDLSYLGLIIFKACYNLVLIDRSVFIQPLGIVWPAAALAAVQLQWRDGGGGLGRLPTPAAVCWM